MVECPKCGSPIKKGQNFCTQCGVKIENLKIKPNMTKYEKEMELLSIPSKVKIEHDLNGKKEHYNGSFEIDKRNKQIKIYYPSNENLIIELTDIKSFKSSWLDKNFIINFTKDESTKEIHLNNVKYGKTLKEYLNKKLALIEEERRKEEKRAERERRKKEMEEKKENRINLIKNTGTMKCLTLSNFVNINIPQDLKRDYLFEFYLNEFEPPIKVFERYLIDLMPAWNDGYFVSEYNYFALKYKKYLFEADPSHHYMETKVLPYEQIFDVIDLKSQSFRGRIRIIALLGTQETIYFALEDDELADITVKTLKEKIQNKIDEYEKFIDDEEPEETDFTADSSEEIGKWFDLLEKGAITQEEYEKKKKELLDN